MLAVGERSFCADKSPEAVVHGFRAAREIWEMAIDQRKLSVAAFDARVHDHLKAAGTLNKMIVAAENGRYVDLRAFHAMLPPTYRTMVGPPPQSRADDQ